MLGKWPNCFQKDSASQTESCCVEGEALCSQPAMGTNLPSHTGLGPRKMRVVQRPLLGFLFGPWLWMTLAQPPSRAPTRQSPPSPTLHFRLAGYPRKHNEGRIEVLYDKEWGTICDDDFTLANAHVLCRHLGFVAATGWTHSAKYGKGVGEHHWERGAPQPQGQICLILDTGAGAGGSL